MPTSVHSNPYTKNCKYFSNLCVIHQLRTWAPEPQVSTIELRNQIVKNLFFDSKTFKVQCSTFMIEKKIQKTVNDVTEGITQESPMGASWVIPRKVDKMVSISSQFSFKENDGCFLLQGRAGQAISNNPTLVVRITQESPIVFFSQSVVTCSALPCSRKHSLCGN